MVGRVVSIKMKKTAVVLVESKKTHPMYGKSYVWSKRYLVDDPMGVGLGDIVIFEKIRPISKHKHWQIAKILGKDIVSLEQAELQEEAAEAIAQVLPEDKEESMITEKTKQPVKENSKSKKEEKGPIDVKKKVRKDKIKEEN